MIRKIRVHTHPTTAAAAATTTTTTTTTTIFSSKRGAEAWQFSCGFSTPGGLAALMMETSQS